MSRLRYNWAAAVAHLTGRCEPLGRFILEHQPERLRPRPAEDLFQALARAIAYQQLSGKAAATIHGRFERLFPDGRPTAERTVDLSEQALRDTGLSRAKTLSVLDLAARSAAGRLPTHRRMGALDDQAIIDALCQVRGIGIWTAQMYLIFNLGRPDVMPATDLGVQKGVQYIYGMRSLPGPRQVLHRTRHLAPFRSAASWYFWRASERGRAGPEPPAA